MSPGAALVTGASSGLGRAVAVELARRDLTVLLLGRDAARLSAAAGEVAAAGGRAVTAVADVREPDALRDALSLLPRGSALRLAIHAAGILSLAGVAEVDDAAFRELMEVNVLGASHVVQAALPRLEEARGRMVLVSSVAGLFALPGGFGAYAASKWAVRGYGETVRAELRARGVGLTLAYPSILDTPMVRELGPQVPGVYRAFPWHPPARAAAALVREALRGRRESYVTPGDRLAAFAARVMPAAFGAGMDALVARRGRR